MKELFTQPEIEIISFEAVDIICTSPVGGKDFGDKLDPTVPVN